MNIHLLSLPLIVLTTAFATAGDDPQSDSKHSDVVTYPAASSPWRVGVGSAQLLGLKTSFSGLGKFNSPFAAQPLGGGVNYDYDNGFVHVDSSGNAGAQSWNWGYQNSSQYQSSGSGTMNFSITNSNADGAVDHRDCADPGIELFAYYDMGAIGFSPLKERKATWGFRGGIHYSHIGVENSGLLATSLTTLTDSFGLNGTVPPSAPYSGSFAGPGPLLGDHPQRTISGGIGSITGNRELDVHLTIADFGTFLEVPVTKEFDLMLEAGVSMAVGSGSYDFTSTTSVTGLGSQLSSGSDSRTSLLPGVYVGLSGTYELTKQWSIQCAGRYQYMNSMDLEANGSKASLSFGSAFVVSLGCVYSF